MSHSGTSCPSTIAFSNEEAGVRTGRGIALALAKEGRKQRAADRKVMPEATGDIREIVGQPVFLPLYKLFTIYGGIFRLSFGPKSFVIISDAQLAKQVRSVGARECPASAVGRSGLWATINCECLQSLHQRGAHRAWQPDDIVETSCWLRGS